MSKTIFITESSYAGAVQVDEETPNEYNSIPGQWRTIFNVTIYSFCGASKAERHIGITLFIVNLSHFHFAGATCIH